MDALYAAVFLVLGLLPMMAAVLVMVAGARRVLGGHSRFDRAAELTASAVSRAVYPPSLRGGGAAIPPPPEEDE